MDSITHKRCSKCEVVKPASEYHKRSNGNKLQPRCKACRKRGQPKEPLGATKVCSKCNGEFPRTREYFWYSKSNTDGLYGFCIACAKHKSHVYYETNKEECQRRSIEWMKRNPDKVKIIKKRAYRPDPIGNKRRGKRWREKHPDQVKVYTAKGRARRRNASGKHSTDDIEQLRNGIITFRT